MTRITVFDTTLRDGEQSPGATMKPAEKLRLAHQLDALGVDVIEAGFPISSPDDYAAVRRVARNVRRPVIAGLARASKLDVERAAEALEPAERARIHVFLATSEIHLTHKLRMSQDQCLDRISEAVALARRLADDVEFSAEDATRTDIAFLCRAAEAAARAGARTINIPDTVGYTHPSEIRRIVESVVAMLEGTDAMVSVHCHNDLGLAVANSLAAIDAGARQVECTVNGIGERAGNASLEELVMALRVRSDAFAYETSIEAAEIFRTSQLLSYITGIHPQPNKAIVGRNAFAHEAGIHQDGLIKNSMTYEIMTPEMVGVPGRRLVLGKHSGRSALSNRYRELGYEVDDAALDKAYTLFKLLADQKKTILDEDLLAILHHGTMDDAPRTYRLRELEVVCGGHTSRATVRLAQEDGNGRVATASGDGPIAAAFSAVGELVDHEIEVEDMTIRSATPGRDAVGEAAVWVRIDGRSFTGRGASTDIVDAAVRALLHAVNKAAQARAYEAEELARANDCWGV